MTTPAPDLHHLCLYNHPAFAALNIVGAQEYLRIDYRAAERLVGSLAGVAEGTTFTSGYSAGFGGPDVVRERERLESIVDMTGHFVEALRGAGFRTLVVRTKPLHYSRNEHYLHFSMLRDGFTIKEENLNFYFDLAQFSDPQDYVDSLRHAPKRQLRLALAEPYRWSPAGEERDWQAAYDVLAESRARHGAELSLSYAYLQRLRSAFPGRVRAYLLERAESVVAACLLYVISERHAQVMYWGDREERAVRGGTQAPIAVMNLVAYHTVAQGLADGLHTVDLGPSTSTGSVNFGNCHFKSTVNALPDFRYVLQRDL